MAQNKKMKSKDPYLFVLGLLFFLCSFEGNAQYKSISLGLYVSPFYGEIDESNKWTTSNKTGLGQFSLGYTFPVHKKFLFTPTVGYALFSEQYHVRTVLTDPLNSAVLVFDETKDKKIQYLKLGIGTTYWPKPFKGFFFEGEILAIMPISAISEGPVPVGTTTYEYITTDYKEEIRSFAPSLKIGAGYSLRIKRLELYASLHFEFRNSAHYKDYSKYNYLSKGISFGAKYLLSTELPD